MRAILAEVETSAEGYDLDALSLLHTELHSLIFEMTGNTYLIGLAIPMVRRGQWLLRQSAPLQTPAAWSEHHWLINAIEAGDPDLAEAAGRHHVLSVRYETNRRQRSPSGPHRRLVGRGRPPVLGTRRPPPSLLSRGRPARGSRPPGRCAPGSGQLPTVYGFHLTRVNLGFIC